MNRKILKTFLELINRKCSLKNEIENNVKKMCEYN